MQKSKKVLAKDWMGSESSEEEAEVNFDRPLLHDEKKGRLAFELQKSYGGDSRFILGKE